MKHDRTYSYTSVRTFDESWPGAVRRTNMRPGANYIVSVSPPSRLRQLTLYIDVRDALLTCVSARANYRHGNDSCRRRRPRRKNSERRRRANRQRIYYGDARLAAV